MELCSLLDGYRQVYGISWALKAKLAASYSRRGCDAYTRFRQHAACRLCSIHRSTGRRYRYCRPRCPAAKLDWPDRPGESPGPRPEWVVEIDVGAHKKIFAACAGRVQGFRCPLGYR
jgi:hypothetical protein